MKFVNMTKRRLYSSYTGWLSAGETSAGKCREARELERVLSGIVKACGDKMGIRLTIEEASLIEKLLQLDEAGEKFDPSVIPAEVLNDPTGEKLARANAVAAQMRDLDNVAKSNNAARRREEEIDGETTDRAPVGPATLKGETVDPSKIKSGFSKILEENARIASGAKVEQGTILDPIGKFSKKDAGGSSEFAKDKAVKAERVSRTSVPRDAGKGDEDPTHSADAKLPESAVTERSGRFDQIALKTAKMMSRLGPSEDESRQAKVAEKAADKAADKPESKTAGKQKSKKPAKQRK